MRVPGREQVLAAYEHAVEAGYRFYSYGDCMLIRSLRWGFWKEELALAQGGTAVN